MKKISFISLLFFMTTTPVFATNCVPKTGLSSAPDNNWIQFWSDSYVQCGGKDNSWHKCNNGVVIDAWDGNIYKCTKNGWEKVENISNCEGELNEIEQKYYGESNGGALYSNDKAQQKKNIYYYNTNEPNGYIAIKDVCAYDFNLFNQKYNECVKNGGDFLHWTDNDTVDLCKEPERTGQQTPTSYSVTPEKHYKEINCRNTGGDRYNVKLDKCECDTEVKHLTQDTRDGYSICKCIKGYKRDNQNNEATGECIDAGDTETHQEINTAQWQKDTEAAYRNEYDNAQSDVNKAITAGSTLLTGEGAMMAARGVAEQWADETAETDMANYIGGMGCEYGGGQTVNLGDDVTLPAGDLTDYYTEYKQTADKLKETKAALNLRPGIESEVLYDQAQSGLYQYQTAEIQSGGNISLARALMNPDSEDAEKWNAQRAETTKDLWTGVGLAAVGAAGGAIASHFANKNHKKEYLELEQKLQNIKTKLEQEYPEIFVPVQDETEVIVIEKPNEIPPQYAPKYTKYTIDIFVDDVAFESGLTLTETAEFALQDAANEINSLPSGGALISEISLTATGYSDSMSISKASAKIFTDEYKQNVDESIPSEYNGIIDKNDKLSKARAEKVLVYLKDKISQELQGKVKTSASADTGTCSELKENHNKCRKVKLTISVQAEYPE